MGELAAGREDHAFTGFGEHVVHEAAGDRRGEGDDNKQNDDSGEVVTIGHRVDYLANHERLGEAGSCSNKAQDYRNPESGSVFF